jgi:hypothetical protein
VAISVRGDDYSVSCDKTARAPSSAQSPAKATRNAANMLLGSFAGVTLPDVRAEDLLVLLRDGSETLPELGDSGGLASGCVDDGQFLDPTPAASVWHLVNTASAVVVTKVRSGAIVNFCKHSLAPRMELPGLRAWEGRHDHARGDGARGPSITAWLIGSATAIVIQAHAAGGSTPATMD